MMKKRLWADRIAVCITVAIIAAGLTACGKASAATGVSSDTSAVSSEADAVESAVDSSEPDSTVSEESVSSSDADSGSDANTDATAAEDNSEPKTDTAAGNTGTAGTSNKTSTTTAAKPSGGSTTKASGSTGGTTAKTGGSTGTTDAASTSSTTNYPVPTQTQANSIANQVLKLVNQERSSKGVCQLAVPSKLHEAAQIRAKEIETVCSHTRPDGTLWSTVEDEVQYGTPYTIGTSNDGGTTVQWQTAYDSGTGAENLAYHVMTGSPDDLDGCAAYLFNQWKTSPGHYANMINGKYTATGIACSVMSDGTANHYCINIIQIFAEKTC